MTSLKWLERFVPDVDNCIALFTMNFPQKETAFVWVDAGILDSQNKSVYRLIRRVEIADAPPQFMTGVFAAYTLEEFMSVLPLNFVPMQARPGVWMVVDVYGTKLHDSDEGGMAARQIVMARVNGSDAATAPNAFAKAAISLIQSGLLKIG